MMNSCSECDVMSDLSNLIECHHCFNLVHPDHIGLTNELLVHVKFNVHIKFYCNDCIDISSYVKNNQKDIDKSVESVSNICELFSKIDHLTAEVADIKEVLSHAGRPSNDVDMIDNSSGDPLMSQSSKTISYSAALMDNKTVAANSALPTLSIHGSAEKCVFENTIKILEPMCYYHMSEFDPLTEVGDVRAWVNGLLNINNAQCIKLVPKNRDLSNLSFVSFKIGVRPSEAPNIMNPEIWPKHLTIKPFETRRSSRNFRPPPQQSTN